MDSETKLNFYQAIVRGDLQAVRKYISSGADPNEKIGYVLSFPLKCACDHNHFNIIKELLIAGADPNKLIYDKPYLLHLFYIGKMTYKKKLLTLQLDCEKLRLFLKYGLDPTQTRSNGWTLYETAILVKKPGCMWNPLADIVIDHVERRTEMATRIQRWWRELYWNPKNAYCRDRIRRQIECLDTEFLSH